MGIFDKEGGIFSLGERSGTLARQEFNKFF